MKIIKNIPTEICIDDNDGKYCSTKKKDGCQWVGIDDWSGGDRYCDLFSYPIYPDFGTDECPKYELKRCPECLEKFKGE